MVKKAMVWKNIKNTLTKVYCYLQRDSEKIHGKALTHFKYLCDKTGEHKNSSAIMFFAQKDNKIYLLLEQMRTK